MQVIRAAILNPEESGRIRFLRDGAILADEAGRIEFAGEWGELERELGSREVAVTQLGGIVTPPFLDAHIHIPQYPIRGQFALGVEGEPEGGRLLAGLNRNVFPAERRNADEEYAAECVRDFLGGTLAQGVIGGAAYMTVHARATEIALELLPPEWSVGMVLMDQNCPEYLRTDAVRLEEDVRRLGRRFGERFIVTDRFAVAVSSKLRRRAAGLARELGLRMQTHLDEQRAEKQFVETKLYPGQTYAGVYAADGLLERRPILAHCIWMKEEEWGLVRDAGAAIAHCPTSNALLGSGVMNLAEVRRRGMEWAICTDVGASPTTSLLCEMAEFLRVHTANGVEATAEEALYRTTLAPARILGLDGSLGSFEPGKSLSYVELAPAGAVTEDNAEAVVQRHLLRVDGERFPPHAELRRRLARQGLSDPAELAALQADVERSMLALSGNVRRVVMHGRQVWGAS